MQISKISRSAYQLHDTRTAVSVGCVVTDEGVVLIDTGSSVEMAGEIRAGVAEITKKPIVYAINTHFHLEHCGGNTAFGVPILAHLSCHARLEQLRASREGARDPIGVPTIAFERDGYLYLGETLIEVAHAPGHTDGSVVVHLPAERVLFAGDNLLVEAQPDLEGSEPVAWLDSLIRMRRLDPAVVVPGKGRLGTVEDLHHLYLYIQRQIGRVRFPCCVSDGLDVEGPAADRVLSLDRARMERAARSRDAGAVRDRIVKLVKSGRGSDCGDEEPVTKRLASR